MIIFSVVTSFRAEEAIVLSTVWPPKEEGLETATVSVAKTLGVETFKLFDSGKTLLSTFGSSKITLLSLKIESVSFIDVNLSL